MGFTMKALLKVITNLEDVAFSRSSSDEEKRPFVVMWSLANEIDMDMDRLHTAVSSLTRRMGMYTEHVASGRLSSLDMPARSSFYIDIIGLHDTIIAKRQSLMTIISLTCGPEQRKAFEKEIT